MACRPPFVARRGITRSGQRTTFCRDPQTGITVGFDMQSGLDRVAGPLAGPAPMVNVVTPTGVVVVPTSSGGGVTTTPAALANVVKASSVARLTGFSRSGMVVEPSGRISRPRMLPSMQPEGLEVENRQALAAARLGTANLSFGGIIRGIGRAAGGLLPGGGIISGAIDALTGGRGSGVVSGPGTGCGPGLIPIGGNCVDPTALLPGGRPFVSPAVPRAPATRVGGGGDRLGSGFPPDMIQSVRSDCGPRHVLGSDGLCYPKRGFPNRDRMWPKGRAPLLTGGERNAITKAAAAARKITRTTKQLQKLGMIRKPTPRRARPPARAAHHEIGPGQTRIINVGD